jgi:hypothetical protein
MQGMEITRWTVFPDEVILKSSGVVTGPWQSEREEAGMKFERRSYPRSAQVFHRRVPRSGDCGSVESKCPACGQMVDKMMEQSLERDGAAVPSPDPVERTSVTEKQLSDSIDSEKLLHFSRQLYAHALTLQEVIRSGGGVTYEVLRPRYDRQAAQQFEVFYHTFKKPAAFRTRGAGSGE